MKSLRTFITVTGFSFAGFMVLGVVLLLAAGPVGAASGDEQSLFNVAENDRWHDDVRALLAKGANPNVPVDTLLQRAAIHVAAEYGAAKNLAAMLQAGGNPNLQSGDGNTPLHLASMGNQGGLTADYPAAIRLLARHGADLHLTNRDGATPLHVAVSNVWSLNGDVVKALLAAGAKPETVDGNGWTVLQGFAHSGADRSDIVTLLLNAGANPDRLTPGGEAPLHLAVKDGSSGKPAVVKALLNGGAEPCVQDAEGYTPYQLSNAQTNTAIRQALGRVNGFDASHAGGRGCWFYGGRSTDQVEAEQESDDSSEMNYEAALRALEEGEDYEMSYDGSSGTDDASEMSYEGAWRALEKKATARKAEAARQAEAERLAEAARRAEAERQAEEEQRAKAARQAEAARRAEKARKADEERRAAAAWREQQAREAAEHARRQAAWQEELEQIKENNRRQVEEYAERQRRMIETILGNREQKKPQRAIAEGYAEKYGCSPGPCCPPPPGPNPCAVQ